MFNRRFFYGLILVGIGTHNAVLSCSAQHADVLTQTSSGKIVIGAADYDLGTWTIGQKVFQRQLLSNFRANDPGFTSLATGNPLLPQNVDGFPSMHNVFFDLLPMRIGSTRSNVFYWNGADSGGDGLSLQDVLFTLPASGTTWNIFDDGFNLFTANATETLVTGGLLQKTSSDTNPGDGIDTGTLHTHLTIRIDDGDGNTLTNPAQGVYLVAMRLRSPGFENSDPFLFVHRSSALSNQTRDLAAEWANLNYASMFALPGDFDFDGDVDGSDFLVWQRGGSPNPLSTGDLANWQNHFPSATGLVSTTAVPEPNTLVITGSLLLGIAGCRIKAI